MGSNLLLWFAAALRLLRVQLDDELLVNLDLDQFLTLGLSKNPAAQSVAVDFEPVGRRCMRRRIPGAENMRVVLAALANFDHVVRPHLEGWDIHLPPIDREMAVADHLARHRAAGAQT